MTSRYRAALVRSLFAALVLTSCGMAHAGIRDAAPPRGDPFTGIADRSKLVMPPKAGVAHLHDKRLAVILSDDTEKHLKWSNDVTGGVSGADRFFKGLFGGAKAIADSDKLHQDTYAPQIVVNSVVEPLVRKAKSLNVVQDMGEFRNGPYDLLVLLDVTFVNTFSDGLIGGTYESGTYIRAYLIDRANTLLASIEVGETRPVPRERFLFVAGDIRREMTARYQREIDRLFGPDKGSPHPAATLTSPAPAPKRSTAERLREVDDLLKQGLIKPDEAEAKRKQILEDI